MKLWNWLAQWFMGLWKDKRSPEQKAKDLEDSAW
jgi:hypothetical protein